MAADVLSTITELVARVTSTGAVARDRLLHAVAEELRRTPGITEPSGLVFRSREHELKVGSAARLRGEMTALASIRELGLAIAPEVVASIPFGDGQCVLVMRYAACPGEELAPLRQRPGALRAAAVERLRQDARKLIAHGWVHPSARGGVHWLVSSETGALVLERWSSLQPAEPGAGDEMLKAIEAEIRRYGVAIDAPGEAKP